MKKCNAVNQNYVERPSVAMRETCANLLDGITLFRFAHMWRNSNCGGVESYLNDLNRQLLHRNKMRILQMYLTSEKDTLQIEIEKTGLGELIWIPSFLKSDIEAKLNKIERFRLKLIRQLMPNSLICHNTLFFTFLHYKPDLAVFHWISEDSRAVIKYINRKRIPFVAVNHFHNERFNQPLIRKQIEGARAVGGVSNIDVPDFINNRFTNLSDSVDTDFFQEKNARSLDKKMTAPIVLLPSRITEQKGHLDAVKAVGQLLRNGINMVLVFAGKLAPDEKTAFMEKLQRLVAEEELQHHVIFAGELTSEELRDWYAASSLVVLPTYAEGLGKVLLEAQAMEKPVIAYNTGGVPEALLHAETGYLVKKGDIVELANHIRKLLEDPAKQREMGTLGRKFVVERFAIDAVTIRHEAFYAEALQ